MLNEEWKLWWAMHIYTLDLWNSGELHNEKKIKDIAQASSNIQWDVQRKQKQTGRATLSTHQI